MLRCLYDQGVTPWYDWEKSLYLFHIYIKQLAMYLPLLFQIQIFTMDDALLLRTIKSYTQL